MKNKIAGERLISAFLDLFMVAVLTLIVLIAFNVILKAIGILEEGFLAFLMRPDTHTIEGIVFGSVMIVIWGTYYGIVPWLMKGSTPAKRILGFQIVQLDGQPASLKQLLIRTIYLWQAILDWCFIVLFLHVLSAQLLYDIMQSILALAFIIIMVYIPYQIITKEDGQGVHDKLAGTKVIIKTVDK